MRASTIRFAGMASGIDTDSIVKDMMRPQQYKIDQQKKQQALIKLKQDAWKDMNKKLYDFHTNYTHKMSMKGSFSATIATSSDEGVVSIPKGQSVPLGTHSFEVTSLATSTSVTGKIDVEKEKILDEKTTLADIGVGAGAFKIILMEGGKEKDLDDLDVEPGDTLQMVATKINEILKNEGFEARYDATNKGFFINATKSGAGKEISFGTGDNNQLFDKLGFNNEGAVKQGADAVYKYNGQEFKSSTNNIEINGFKATLKSESKAIISSEADAEATYNFIKEFVTEYNKLIDEINEKLSTKPGKDILPLTSEEREAMSDGDIKLWEDKLNSSLFYKDDQLANFANTSRSILGKVLGEDVLGKDSKYNSLVSLGIVTGTWQEKGKLHIIGDDPDPLYSGKTNKLKEAISGNPEDVIKLLNRLGKELYDAHTTAIKSDELRSALHFYNDKAMKKQVDSFEKRIATMEERMYKMEDMQYRKFAAMEKMLSSLNSQGSWLAQQFGGM